MISVIIPAYNAEKYIDKCLESVLTKQDADYEVIVVNDGSTDKTGEICCKWKEKSDCLIYINQQNMGQGSARNTAIAHARGEWLAFLDADDEMMPHALTRLQQSIDEETDIIWYEHWLLRKNAQEKERFHILLEEEDNEYLLCETTTFLWDKLIRKECWDKQNINLCNIYGEDMMAVCQLITKSRKVKLLKSPLLIHYDREENLSSKPERVVEILQATKDVIDYFCNTEEFEKYKEGFFFFVLKQYKLHESRMNPASLDESQYEYLSKGFLALLENYFPKKWKIAQSLMQVELILIGKTKMLGFLWQFFKSVRGYNNMDSYLFDRQKRACNLCIYYIDVRNEGKSTLHGTRSAEWDLDRWKEKCEVFRNQIAILGEPIERMFIAETIGKYGNALHTDMITAFEEIVNAERLPNLYGILGKLEIENKYCKPQVNPAISEQNYEGSAEILRYEYNANIMNSWLKVKCTGHSLAETLDRMGYHRIAVYGAGFLGERLIEELEDSNIRIEYLIDKTGKGYRNLPVYTLEDSLPRVDAVVVTVVHLYHFIEPEIERVFWRETEVDREKMRAVDVVSLEEIVLESR